MNETVCLDPQRIINQQAFGKFHLKLVALCALAVLMDGFDAQSMGFVAPSLARQWHIARAGLGPILTSGLVGMLIGALVFGPLADRFGRKSILVLCTFWFGAFSLLTTQAESVQSMVLLRFITGFGLGGAMPNAIALTSEYMPSRLRSTGVTLMFSGFSIGAAVGGFVAAGLIARFGWQAVFLVGGLLPCVTALFLLRIPESVRFLVLKGGEDVKVAILLRKIAPDVQVSVGTSFTVPEHREEGFVVGRLFTHGRARLTMLLWVIFFMSLLDLFFLSSWLPTILNDSGFGLRTAILITTMFQVGGTAGAFLLGRFFDRTKSFRALAWAYAGGAVCVFFIGMAGRSVVFQGLAVFMAGVCVIGSQTGSNALAADCYTTAVRSTGVGWALGIGRIGSIVGPIVGGILLSSNLEMRRVFWAAAVPPVIAMLAAIGVNFRRGRASAPC